MTNSTDILNRVLSILARSFPMYLKFARPYRHSGDEQSMETLEHVVADQEAMVERIATFIYDSESDPPNLGEFPMEYTDVHDLGLDYLLKMAVDYQRRDVADLEDCAARLRMAPTAKALAEEALGAAKGHLESLEESLNQPA